MERRANPRFWRLLTDFHRRTGCAALVNTSFNVRGEPIVADAEDAYHCFLRTGMDLLVIDDCLFRREDQRAEPPPVDIPPD